jgi:hypothetical protein
MPEPTPEQLGREAGEAIANAIADNLEAVIMRLADSIAEIKTEQAELRDEGFALGRIVAANHAALTNELRTLEARIGGPESL